MNLRLFIYTLILLWGGCISSFAHVVRSDSTIMKFLSENGISFTHNNSAVLLKSGDEKFQDMFSAIKQAKETIHLEYFNFRNDSIGNALFDLLAEKVKQGVKVRALFDSFGNESNNRPLRKRHMVKLRKRGIEIYEYDPLRFPWINHVFHRDHRKIVVIDGLVAYTGGMNVADYYIKGKPDIGDWRDMHLRLEGDVVCCLQGIFLRMWNQVSGQHISGPELYPGMREASDWFDDLKPDTTRTAGIKNIAVVNREPELSPRIIRETFVAAINSAQHQIQLINPYFTLNRKIRKALKHAIDRGVDVQIMVSEASDIPITPRVVDYNAKRLMKKGAEIYYYQGGFHHSKVMMIDSLYSFVGSANLNSRSLAYDYECNVMIVDSCTTRELQHLFNSDKKLRCYRLTPEKWKQRPWGLRMQAWLFHFLEPFI